MKIKKITFSHLDTLEISSEFFIGNMLILFGSIHKNLITTHRMILVYNYIYEKLINFNHHRPKEDNSS